MPTSTWILLAVGEVLPLAPSPAAPEAPAPHPSLGPAARPAPSWLEQPRAAGPTAPWWPAASFIRLQARQTVFTLKWGRMMTDLVKEQVSVPHKCYVPPAAATLVTTVGPMQAT
jgi:hypothetical protein